MDNPTKPAPQDSHNEPRKGDSAFLPVVIAAGVALLVILAVAAFLVHSKSRKLIPKTPDAHPTSHTIPLTPNPPLQPQRPDQAS